MTQTISGRADDRAHGIEVEVGPGGALRRLELQPEALQLGRHGLATAILDLVRKANAQASQRTRHALRDELAGLTGDELELLGLTQDAALTESVESTTPDTWRA
ncbi:YbaB/EbfC family DNA-binding protein [Amycolatopsis anabasis]|uniref:YbaB/EbfC family DNA-binding protein n=1 Tax=Amycolatopsis anabasis TaxID=1840409 RepID=UPI00131A900A|nr:YbaB/EbfC family DNA-binding protein [Amycolatopsis anabasis]